MQKTKLRPLLPRTSSIPSEACQEVALPLPRKRQPQVRAACNGCRKRKVKCDGIRPMCSSCSFSQMRCVFPVPEGLSQREAQKQQLTQMTGVHEKSRRVLELLSSSPYGASLDILQKLRQARNLDEAIEDIADASLLLPNAKGDVSPDAGSHADDPSSGNGS